MNPDRTIQNASATPAPVVTLTVTVPDDMTGEEAQLISRLFLSQMRTRITVTEVPNWRAAIDS